MKTVTLAIILPLVALGGSAAAFDGARTLPLRPATQAATAATAATPGASGFVMTCRFLNEHSGRAIDWCAFFPRARGLYR